ncbi:hypothetical protein ACLOJK_023539 [Asimina triloba]
MKSERTASTWRHEASYFALVDVQIWTSTLQRTIITASPIVGFPKIQWRALDEINAGVCDGMTYEEIKKNMPEEYEVMDARRFSVKVLSDQLSKDLPEDNNRIMYQKRSRKKDKLRYRYPRGESYLDVIQRLEPVIIELERQRAPVVVISHQAVLRALYAYFADKPLKEIPHIEVPLHTIIEIQMGVTGVQEKSFAKQERVWEIFTIMSSPSYPAIIIPPQEHHLDNTSYPFNAKIMVVAVATLLVVTSFVLLLHVYAKWWFVTRSRGRRLSLPDLPPPSPSPMLSQLLRRRHAVDDDAAQVGDHGLDPRVIARLPTFVCKWDGSGRLKAGLECVVCLSLFEENEKGRMLPKCHHAFHVDCIDMWLMSHSTCPLCRKNVVVGNMEEAALELQIIVEKNVE